MSGQSVWKVLAGTPIVPELAWLGRQKGWISFGTDWTTERTPKGEPCTLVKCRGGEYLRTLPGADKHRHLIRSIDDLRAERDQTALSVLEAMAVFYADGPKQFTPTEEQWNSMEHVDLHIPVTDYTQPYPAMVINIPPASRERLAKECGIQDWQELPIDILIRLRNEPGENPIVITQSGKFGSKYENCYIFQHQKGNETIEKAINRIGEGWAESQSNKDGLDEKKINLSGFFKYGMLVARAAMNLCLMLTRYGYHINTPEVDEAKLRRMARNRLKHGRAPLPYNPPISTILMNQEIVIRDVRSSDASGNHTGAEIKPHWRRGHWRSKPGQKERRRAGEKVDLLFIKPVLVRSDRAVGDLCLSRVEYKA